MESENFHPELSQTQYGKWVAKTPPGLHPAIAVIGDSDEDALAKFADELAAWQELHERPTPAPKRQSAKW